VFQNAFVSTVGNKASSFVSPLVDFTAPRLYDTFQINEYHEYSSIAKMFEAESPQRFNLSQVSQAIQPDIENLTSGDSFIYWLTVTPHVDVYKRYPD